MAQLAEIHLRLFNYIFKIDLFQKTVKLAKIGQIHPSLISTQKLLSQFKEIKVSLPKGTDLPVDLNLPNIYDLLRLSHYNSLLFS